MTTAHVLRKALRDFKEGALDEEAILELLHDLPYEDLKFAKWTITGVSATAFPR